MDNEFILFDRLEKIKSTVNKWGGEENFVISYSGGADSNVVSALFDLALPDNKIPRLYCNTGIEYKMIVDFVKEKAEKDNRFIIIKPNVPIKKMLEEKGYPFKSKNHSLLYKVFMNSGMDSKTVLRYLKLDSTVEHYKNEFCCPECLKYQFTENNGLSFKISDDCCKELKQKPLDTWQKENHKPIKVLGLMKSEKGRRALKTACHTYKNDKLHSFQPLIAETKEWEDWFIHEYNVELPALYYPPYNFERTGCVACPFNVHLQRDLDVLAELLPNEKKLAESIWKPVYSEYRRLGYRLRKVDEDQLTFE